MRDHDPLHEDHEDPLEPQSKDIFSDLGEARRIEPQWVIENLLPVGLTIIGAPPKEGKSVLAMVCAASVAGLHPRVLPEDLRHVPEEGKVLCFSYEASAGELKVMMEDGVHVQVPADGRILVVDDPWAWRLDDEMNMPVLFDILSKQQPKLVIMDTFRDMHDLEEKDSGAMVRLLRPLREWAVRWGAALMLVHHTVKVSDDVTQFDPKHLRGSGAIYGKADGIIMMTRRADGKYFIKTVFKRARGWERTLQLALYDVREGGEPLVENDVLVLKGLTAGASLNEIADQLHVGKLAVVNMCAKLARNGYLEKDGPKWRLTRKEVVR